MEIKLKKERFGIPLYWQIKEDIKEKIKNGEYKIDELIPSETELVKKYDVSRITIVKAINELVSEGYLYRIQGKGTFVKAKSGGLKEEEIVAIIMPTEGHLWEPLTRKIIKGLQGKYLCIPIDFIPENKGIEFNKKSVSSIIEKNPKFLIVDGTSAFPFELLKKYGGKVIYVINYENDKENENASYILSDYYYGGKIAVEYLLSKGFKRVILFTYPPREDHKMQKEVIKGGKDAFKKKGLSEDDFVIFSDWEDEEKVIELLKKERKPIGIFSEGDFRAKIIYESAHKLNLKIPYDISVIGYYNTPWCEMFNPKLTSISIKEEEIGDIVVKKILNKEELKDKIIVKPEVVERESVIDLKK